LCCDNQLSNFSNRFYGATPPGTRHNAGAFPGHRDSVTLAL
jgi:hypothetical protein